MCTLNPTNSVSTSCQRLRVHCTRGMKLGFVSKRHHCRACGAPSLWPSAPSCWGSPCWTCGSMCNMLTSVSLRLWSADLLNVLFVR